MNEAELRDQLLVELEDIKGALHLGKEVPIPYKHIYLPATPKKPKLEIWCFKQDIVFYEVLFDKTIRYKDAVIKTGSNDIIDIVLEKDNAQNINHVGLPHVIIETKVKQPNTHDILTYSQKVEMIKTIFPYCKFIFLIFGKISPRTFRHGLNFDEIISITDINSELQIDHFKKTVKNLLSDVKKDVSLLKASPDQAIIGAK